MNTNIIRYFQICFNVSLSIVSMYKPVYGFGMQIGALVST